jgi:hypothetical protein
MKFKDYVNEHYIFEKHYNNVSLANQLSHYYKMHGKTLNDIISDFGSIKTPLQKIMKAGDTYTPEEDVINNQTGEIFAEKGKTISYKDLEHFKKLNKQSNRKHARLIKQDKKSSQRDSFEYNLTKAKDVSEFEEGYNIEYKTLSHIYPPEEAGVPQNELDYDYDMEVPVKVTRKDKLNMNQDDKNNMKRLITLLKKSHHNIDFHGEMPLGGKFYTIDVYLK